MTGKIVERLLWMGKRLSVVGIIAVMIAAMASGCAKKTEEEFEFSGSPLEENREEVSGGDDTTPDGTDEPQEEGTDEDAAKPNEDVTKPGTEPDNTPGDATDSDEPKDEEPDKDTVKPDAKPDAPEEDTTDSEKPGEETQKPDEDDTTVDGETPAAPVIPEISAVAMMNGEQALAALEGISYTTLENAWLSYQIMIGEDERCGIFSFNFAKIGVYYNADGWITEVKFGDELEEDIDDPEEDTDESEDESEE